MMIMVINTHDAGVTGADVIVRLPGRVPDTEVVCLLLELGEVEGPGLLLAEVHLPWGHGLLSPPPEWTAEHGSSILVNKF